MAEKSRADQSSPWPTTKSVKASVAMPAAACSSNYLSCSTFLNVSVIHFSSYSQRSRMHQVIVIGSLAIHSSVDFSRANKLRKNSMQQHTYRVDASGESGIRMEEMECSCMATTAQLVQMLQAVPLSIYLCRCPCCRSLDLHLVDTVPDTLPFRGQGRNAAYLWRWHEAWPSD